MYIMPDTKGERTCIVVSSALQMGWCQSPVYFCDTTETAKEVMESLQEEDAPVVGLFEMEQHMTPTEPVQYIDSPLELLQKYVDDFVFACQPSSPDQLKNLPDQLKNPS